MHFGKKLEHQFLLEYLKAYYFGLKKTSSFSKHSWREFPTPAAEQRREKEAPLVDTQAERLVQLRGGQRDHEVLMESPTAARPLGPRKRLRSGIEPGGRRILQNWERRAWLILTET